MAKRDGTYSEYLSRDPEISAQEMYGLSSHLRRAAVSVPSNIAEGKGRSSDKELQFLSRARGSIYEVQTQLEIAESLAYLDNADRKTLSEEADDVARMLNGMIAEFRQITTPPGVESLKRRA